jgi:hypothetical protein
LPNAASNPGNDNEVICTAPVAAGFAPCWPDDSAVGAQAAAWTVKVEEQNGLPTVTRGGGPAMIAKFDFWGADWDWTGFYAALKVNAPYHYTLEGKNKDLDFDLKADISRPGERTLAWNFDLDAHSRKTKVMGGGMVFQFDPALVAGEMGAPQLLPGNRGWSWGNDAQGRRWRCASSRRWPRCTSNAATRPSAFFYSDPIEPVASRSRRNCR